MVSLFSRKQPFKHNNDDGDDDYDAPEDYFLCKIHQPNVGKSCEICLG